MRTRRNGPCFSNFRLPSSRSRARAATIIITVASAALLGLSRRAPRLAFAVTGDPLGSSGRSSRLPLFRGGAPLLASRLTLASPAPADLTTARAADRTSSEKEQPRKDPSYIQLYKEPLDDIPLRRALIQLCAEVGIVEKDVDLEIFLERPEPWADGSAPGADGPRGLLESGTEEGEQGGAPPAAVRMYVSNGPPGKATVAYFYGTGGRWGDGSSTDFVKELMRRYGREQELERSGTRERKGIIAVARELIGKVGGEARKARRAELLDEEQLFLRKSKRALRWSLASLVVITACSIFRVTLKVFFQKFRASPEISGWDEAWAYMDCIDAPVLAIGIPSLIAAFRQIEEQDRLAVKRLGEAGLGTPGQIASGRAAGDALGRTFGKMRNLFFGLALKEMFQLWSLLAR